MLASTTRTALARAGAAPAARVAARRTALRTRRYGTVTEQAHAAVKASEGFPAPSPGAGVSHAMAGVAGGATVLLGGYLYYRSSGLATMVDTAKQAQARVKETKDRVTASVQSTLNDTSASEALKYLRSVAKSYVVMVPGAGAYVDQTFDELDKVASEHGEDAKAITQRAYDDVQKVYADAKAQGTLDLDVAWRVMQILASRGAELAALGSAVGGTLADDFLSKHPELKERVGGGYSQLLKLAQDKGPEAKKLIDDVQKQIGEILAKGPTPEALAQARTLVQDKAQQLQSMVAPAAQEAWDKSLREAQPYLEKLPEAKDLLNSKASAFLGLGASALGGGAMREIFDSLKGAAEATGKDREQALQKLKALVEDKAKQAQEKAGLNIGWDDIVGYVKMIPGGEDMLKKIPNAEALAQLAQARGGDAGALAQETWDDVLKLLDEKAQKARKLAESTKEDAKKEAKDSKK